MCINFASDLKQHENSPGKLPSQVVSYHRNLKGNVLKYVAFNITLNQNPEETYIQGALRHLSFPNATL